MTTWGGKLDGVDEEQLRQQLRTEKDGKAVKRLTSALLYLQGNSPAEIENLLGFPEQIVYDWLDTVAERDPTDLADLARPGQSTRLTDAQWTELTATLAASPSEAGYDDLVWTAALVREHIAECTPERVVKGNLPP